MQMNVVFTVSDALKPGAHMGEHADRLLAAYDAETKRRGLPEKPYVFFSKKEGEDDVGYMSYVVPAADMIEAA